MADALDCSPHGQGTHCSLPQTSTTSRPRSSRRHQACLALSAPVTNASLLLLTRQPRPRLKVHSAAPSDTDLGRSTQAGMDSCPLVSLSERGPIDHSALARRPSSLTAKTCGRQDVRCPQKGGSGPVHPQQGRPWAPGGPPAHTPRADSEPGALGSRSGS